MWQKRRRVVRLHIITQNPLCAVGFFPCTTPVPLQTQTGFLVPLWYNWLLQVLCLSAREPRVESLSLLNDVLFLCFVKSIHLQIHIAAKRASFLLLIFVFLLESDLLAYDPTKYIIMVNNITYYYVLPYTHVECWSEGLARESATGVRWARSDIERIELLAIVRF